MKCSVCGCDKLVRVGYTNGPDKEQTLEAYACMECRHVDLYVPQERFDIIKSRLKDEDLIKKANEDKEKKAELLKKEIAELEKIANDDSQSVRTVREANAKLDALREELKDMGVIESSGGTHVWKN